jgi:hypothetical protein
LAYFLEEFKEGVADGNGDVFRLGAVVVVPVGVAMI